MYGRHKAVIRQIRQKETIKTSMKAYSDNKTVYISDFIKQKHKKRRVKQLIHYKYSKKTNEASLAINISSFNLSVTVKAEE